MKEAQYLGWIPCISGHLDFGLMKVGLSGSFTHNNTKDEHFIEANVSAASQPDHHHRLIVLQSKVDWRDSPKVNINRGVFRVVVTAEVVKSNNMDKRHLKGHILIYSLAAEHSCENERKKMNVHQLCHDFDKNKDKTQARQIFEKLGDITSGKTSITRANEDPFVISSIRFDILPNGICRLFQNEQSLSGFNDEKSPFIIARQAFYYLKYAIHTHKHHYTTQDSLTTITHLSNSDNKSDREAVAVRLICQLKRELTALKRTQRNDCREHPTSNANGIIAYAKSFITSLQYSGYICCETAQREHSYFDNLASSFGAQTERINSELNNLELAKSKAKVWLGFVIVSTWGFINFSNTAQGNEAFFNSYNTSIAIIPFIVLIACTYLAIRRFYTHFNKPDANEALINTAEKSLWLKIGIAFSLIVLALYVLANVIPAL